MKARHNKTIATIRQIPTLDVKKAAILSEVCICRGHITHMRKEILDCECELATEHDRMLWMRKLDKNFERQLTKSIAECNWHIRAYERQLERLWQEMAKTI